MLEVFLDYLWLFVLLSGMYWIGERVVKGLKKSNLKEIEQTNNWLREHMGDHGTGKFDGKLNLLIDRVNDHIEHHRDVKVTQL